MSISISDYYKFSVLSQAVYAHFEGIPLTVDTAVRQELRAGGAGDFTESQALAFTNATTGYSVLHQSWPDDPTGFSATVFRQRDTQVATIAIRGVDDRSTIPQDLLGDDDILLRGIAAAQLVSLYNYYRRLTTPTGTPVPQYELVLESRDAPPPGTPKITTQSAAGRAQFYVYTYLRETTPAFALDLISPQEHIRIAGHSLGGHLAAAFSRLFPGVVDDAYLYNAPGFNPSYTDRFLALFPEYRAQPVPFNPDVIHRVVGTADDAVIADPNPVAHFLTPAVAEEPVYIENATHSIVSLTDALAVQSLYQSVDPTLTAAQIQTLFEATAVDRDTTIEGALDALAKLLLPSGQFQPTAMHSTPPGTGAGDVTRRDELHTHVQTLQQRIEAINDQQLFPGLRITSLVVGHDAASIALAAQASVAYRYALAELNPFVIEAQDGAVTAALYDQHNPNGVLDELSPAYLIDRAAFLAVKMGFGARDITARTDHTPYTTTYSDSTLALQLEDGGGNAHYVAHERFVLFGSEAADTLRGGPDNDALYGGAGDDTLRSNGPLNDEDNSPDRLEGGRGVDTYYVGAGDIVRDLGREAVIFAGAANTPIAGNYERVADNVYRNAASNISLYVQGNDAVVALFGVTPPLTFTIENFKDDGVAFQNGGYGLTKRSGSARVPMTHQ